MLVLLDVNVILDVLGRREPHYEAAAELWSAIEAGEATGLIAAHTVTTLYYLLQRHANSRQATAAVRDLMRVFSVAAVDEAVLSEALGLKWEDFEDAVQMAAAARAGAEYLITRNPGDFEGGTVPVLGPGEFTILLRGTRGP
jgi:predicted nucleic acid-binding protein